MRTILLTTGFGLLWYFLPVDGLEDAVETYFISWLFGLSESASDLFTLGLTGMVCTYAVWLHQRSVRTYRQALESIKKGRSDIRSIFVGFDLNTRGSFLVQENQAGWDQVETIYRDTYPVPNETKFTKRLPSFVVVATKDDTGNYEFYRLNRMYLFQNSFCRKLQRIAQQSGIEFVDYRIVSGKIFRFFLFSLVTLVTIVLGLIFAKLLWDVVTL